MKTYLTELQVWNKTLCWPNIKANSFEEAEQIAWQKFDEYTVVWVLVKEIV